MDTRNINLFVFDTKENYDKSKAFLGSEPLTFKRMFCVNDLMDFETHFNNLGEDELVFIVIHVFYTGKLLGITTFKNSGIPKKYPKIEHMFISDGDEKDIQHKLLDEKLSPRPIFKYHEVYSNLEEDKVKVLTKREILAEPSLDTGNVTSSQFKTNNYPQIDYAIIVALYQDEFEELQKIFDFPEADQIKTKNKVFHIGYLKSKIDKKVVCAIPNASGMIDSAIIATQLLEFFRPKYLLMSGVCGGASSYNIGDIIIAKQVYTFQKGKLSDIHSSDSPEVNSSINLFDNKGNIIDYTKLYDSEGKLISISIEKFEIEHDAIINLDSLLKDSIEHKLKKINQKINMQIETDHFFSEKKSVNIEIEPIACSTMVINKRNYFEDTIKSVSRKTAAVEMESYGVARACQFANNGETKHIIFKSVMDNTNKKSDSVLGFNVKKFAAYTSAQFMKNLFEEGII